MRFLLYAALAVASLNTMAEPLTIERIFAGGSLDGPSPRALKISPDGKRVTVLRAKAADQNRFDLWAYEIENKQLELLVDADTIEPADGETVSMEEQARRERARTAGFSGIVDYQWSADGSQLLFPLSEQLYLYTLGA
ncbi:MAG: S9 family peptidase, partial [Dokdonella sp.]